MENIRNAEKAGHHSLSQPFRLGPWLISPATSQISGDDQTHTLEPLVMEVLCILAASPGDVISKDRFIDLAWQGRAVSDNAVSRVITELRKALGDHPRQPTYIQTISRKGYCLVAPVAPVHPPNVVLDSPGDQLVTHAKTRQKPRRMLLAAIFIIAIIIGLVILLPKATTSVPIQSPKVTPNATASRQIVTSRKGIETDPSFSADGQFLLYCHFSAPHVADGVLVLRDMQSMQERVVTDRLENATDPTWSASMDRFAYLAHGSGQTQLRSRHISPSDAVIGPPEIMSQGPQLERQTRIAWAQQDQSLIFNQRVNSQAPFQIHTLNPKTGQVTQQTLCRQGGLGDFDFAVRHGGEQLAILRSPFWNTTQILLYNLQTQVETPLIKLPYPVRDISWLQDQILMFRTPEGLITLDTTTLEMQSLGAETDRFHRPLRRPQSDQLLALQFSSDRDIWEATTQPDQEMKHHNLVSSNRNDSLPRVNHAETQLAFVSDRSGRQQVWELDLGNRQHLRQLSNFTQDIQIKDLKWSPRDQRILLWCNDRELLLLDVNSGKTQPLPVTQAAMPAWSPDGEMIYFASDQENDWQIKAYSLVTKQVSPITETGGFVFLANDQDTFLLKFYQPGLWQLNGEKPLLSFPDARFWRSWALTEKELFFPGETDDFRGVFAFNPVEKSLRPAFPLKDPEHSHFSITSDGSRIFYDQIARKDSDFFLMPLPERFTQEP